MLSSVLSVAFSSVGHVFPVKTKKNMERQHVTDNVVLRRLHLLINLSEPFFDTTVGPRPNLARQFRDETGCHQKKLTNPTPEGFRGLFIDVGGMFVACLWHVCGMFVGGMIQAGGR